MVRRRITETSYKAPIVARYLIGAGLIGVKATSRAKLMYERSPMWVFSRRPHKMTYQMLLRELEESGPHPILIQASVAEPDEAVVIMWLKDFAHREVQRG